MNFQQPFNRKDWLQFLKNDFLPDDFIEESERIEFNSDILTSVEILGKSPSLEVSLLEIRYNSKKDPRITLSREAFRILNENGIRRSLVFFISENPEIYRFSLVTFSTALEGKKIKRQFSNPRRKSFLLGIGQKLKTPRRYLIEKGRIKDFLDLENRFNVEVVTKEFYGAIQHHFLRLVGGKIIKGKTEIEIDGSLRLPGTDQKTGRRKYQEFGVRLLGRLIFCWFLKKKLFPDNSPLISDKILSSSALSYGNYYHTILEKLFFETLNKKIGERNKLFFPADSQSDFYKIPFLNGGLFEPHHDDFYKPDSLGNSSFLNSLVIPDKWLGELFETLELYNFTIDEHSTEDAEMSIDPEILGRIFENLLAEINPETGKTARNESGSFYTPREIVDYMVEESLQAYLQSKFPQKHRQPLEIENFLSLAADSGRNIEQFCKQFPSKYLRISAKPLADKTGFDTVVIFPRILLKLSGKAGTPHPEIIPAIWKSFLNGEFRIIDAFFGKPKRISLSRSIYHWVSISCILEIDGSLYVAFFTPLLSGELGLNTVFRINEKRIEAYRKEHHRILTEEIEKKDIFANTLQKRNSRRDADSPHQTRSPRQLSDKFSAVLHEFRSRSIVEDEELYVKFGGGSALLREVQEVIAGASEDEAEEKVKEKIIEALDDLKILDPACGSGAFPMGIVQKVLKILQEIDPDNKRYLERIIRGNPPEVRESVRDFLKKKDLNYIRKLGIIQKSIFGVDIQEIAVEIARLRCFLSLIVNERVTDNEKDNYGIEALPNLEFKFVSADALIPLPENRGLLTLFDDSENLNELKKIRDEYFQSTGEKKEGLKEKFAQVQEQIFAENIHDFGDVEHKKKSQTLAQWQPFSSKSACFFDPEWMFGVTDFDIVIGNPPYVQLQENRGELADKYISLKYESFTRAGNIYCLFYERGLKLSKPESGVLCYITMNQWMQGGYGKELRGFFAKYEPLKLLDFGGFKVFDAATVNTNILLIQNIRFFPEKEGLRRVSACHLKNDYKKGDDLAAYFKQNKTVLSDLSSDTWIIGNDAEVKLKMKIETVGIPLKKWDIKINRGVLTGLNPAFIIDQKTRNNLVAKDSKNAEILKPILRGQDIKRYSHDWTGLYLIMTGFNADIPTLYPFVYQYLKSIGDKIEAGELKVKGKGLYNRDDQGKNWWNLRACDYYEDFEREKIAWGNLCINSQFSLVESNMFINAPSCFISSGSKYLIAILNSKVSDWYIRRLGVTRNGGYFEYKPMFVDKLPVIKEEALSRTTKEQFESLVGQIISAKKANPQADTSTLERQIDILVFKLYGLTLDEIKIVAPEMLLTEEEGKFLEEAG